MSNKIQLSDHFDIRRLLRFSIPSIVMMVFTSIYSVVDGLFVANVVGSNALSAINIVSPLIMIIAAFGFMLGAGGSAEVSKTLGEGKDELAREYFTSIIATVVVCGILLSALAILFVRPLSYLLGASDLIIEDCVTYGTIFMIGIVFFMLQTCCQTFFVAAEKPKIGLALTVVCGITNIVLDYVFVFLFQWGIAGAALASVAGCMIGGIFPLFYFYFHRKSRLHFARIKWYPMMLLRSCGNGVSEMISNVSASFVVVLYNLQLMKLVGETGVAAFSAIMYVNFLFMAIFFGFSFGVAPVISYHYGAANRKELHSLFKKSVLIIAVVSVSMFLLAQESAFWISKAFAGGNEQLSELTTNGFRVYAIGFLVCGMGVFGSAFFTALCNGILSASISVLRTLILPVIFILLLPHFWGIQGVWWTIVFAEGIGFMFTLFFLIKNRKKYGY